MSAIDPIKVQQFEDIKDLITKARAVSTEENIKHPKIILGAEWAWILEEPDMIEFIKRMTKAESVALVAPSDVTKENDR